jgi:Gpi18-like mannosyltransferase
MDYKKILKNMTASKKALAAAGAFTVIWLAFCLSLLFPHIRNIIIEYVQDNVVHKIINYNLWDQRLIKFAFAGFALPVFFGFLFLLEKIVIARKDNEKINWEPLFFAAITILAALIRFGGFGHKTGDFFTQSEWVAYLRQNDHFFGFKTVPANYNAIYLYLCGIMSYIPVSLELYVMKIFSCIFDFICAVFSMKILRRITSSAKIGMLAYAVILFSPTVVLNSGVWAQCDSMYAAFLVVSLFYIINEKPAKSMICFGIGLSFKLQAIFMFPAIILVFIYRKWSLRGLLYGILGFFAVSIPAWFFGWPLYKWFINYFAGTDTADLTTLTMNAPTIFSWGVRSAAVPVLFITAALVMLGFLIISKKGNMSYSTLLLLFLFCNFAVPFFLPNMHERYFYAGEIAVLLYSIYNPKRFYISFLVIMPGVITYLRYLYGVELFTLSRLSVVMLAGIIFITKWLIESILADQKITPV